MRTPLATWALATGLLVACGGEATEPPASTDSSGAVDVIVVGPGDGASATDTGRGPADAVIPTETSAPPTDVTSDAAPGEACGDGVCAEGESCESCAADCPVCPPVAGSMVITEIMKDPAAVMDSQGEWIELVNASDEAVDLKGMVLRDLGGDEHLIDPEGGLLVAPGEFVVLSVTADLGVGVSADYVLSGFYLDNGADEVILEADGVIVDSVAYDEQDFVDPTGAAMQFHGGMDPDAVANDDGENWCAATTSFGAGDKGTPGEANPPCDECGDGVCGVTELCDVCVPDCGACTPCDQGGAASDEYCNGIDDDCDGALDEDTCADTLPCTEDFCVPGQGCGHEVVPGPNGELGCAIEGQCVADGAYQLDNACSWCDVDTTQLAWTDTNNLGPCNDGDTCTTSDRCVLGECGGDAIEDSYEHNDTKSVATDIGAIGDGADWPAGQVGGASLFGEGDEDWFKYTVSDDWLGSFAPRADLASVPSGSSYEICLYMLCDVGKELELKSCKAGEESESDGMKGCCATDSVQLEVNCDGMSESGTLYVKVSHASGPWTCDHYAFQWGDD